MRVSLFCIWIILALAGFSTALSPIALGGGQTDRASKPSATPTPTIGPTVGPSPNSPTASERLIDSSIPDDPAVDSMLAAYSGKVRELDLPIGSLEGELKKDGLGGGSIGNFVTDAIKARAQAESRRAISLAVTNAGGLRKNAIAAGPLSARDMFELLPFENALVTIDLTGAQLEKLLTVIVDKRDPQSGALINIRKTEKNKDEMVSARIISKAGPQAIDPLKTYTVVTTDYLAKRGGDYGVLKDGKNMSPIGLTLRQALIDYVKGETAAGRRIGPVLDSRFVEVPGSAPQSGVKK